MSNVAVIRVGSAQHVVGDCGADMSPVASKRPEASNRQRPSNKYAAISCQGIDTYLTYLNLVICCFSNTFVINVFCSFWCHRRRLLLIFLQAVNLIRCFDTYFCLFKYHNSSFSISSDSQRLN